MKTIVSKYGREKNQETLFKSGGFTYRLDEGWGKLPENLNYTPICSGCCDKERRVYLISRDYYNPIIVLDENGEYIKSMGKGLFTFIHGIRCTPWNTLICVETEMHILRELTFDGEHIRDIGKIGVPSDSGYDPFVWRRKQRAGDIVAANIGYDPYWAFVESLPTIKRMASPFNKPTGVDFNSHGEAFCSDGYGNAAIHKFTRDFELVKTWGGPGREPGKFL
ncbi:MAG: hypothetical protein AAGU32_19065, partial [Bacillota bacterium]